MKPISINDVEQEDAAYRAAIAFLWERINYERTGQVPYRRPEFGLARMCQLMDLLGNPQERLRIVHIAGTKGKGSTAVMTAAALTRCGLRVGLYTSPHLERLEERFVLDGRPCMPADIVRCVEAVRPAVDELDRVAREQGGRGPTFFEITTAMAFWYFAQAATDAVVLEVGMGGRLDSTNVCHPAICLITSVSFDHTKQLGNTLAAIAGEKAGIIKPAVPVVTGVRNEEPLQVIQRVAAERGAPLFRIGHDFEAHVLDHSGDRHGSSDGLADEPSGEVFRYVESPAMGGAVLGPLRLALRGVHQVDNAAVAIAALRRLATTGWPIAHEAIQQGVQEARLPGRLEIVAREPFVLLDVAHNVASIAALVKFLDSYYPHRRRRFLVSIARDKDIGGMLETLIPAAAQICLTQFTSNPRASDPYHLAERARQIAAHRNPALVIDVVPDPLSGWRWLRSAAASDDVLCITGSFFLVGELRPFVVQPMRQTDEVCRQTVAVG